MSKDGLLEGPSFPLYKEIVNNVPDVHLIASGGVATVQDLRILEN